MSNTTDNSKTFATKLSLQAANKFEKICEHLETNPYTIIQQAVTSFIKFADIKNQLDPQLRTLMELFFTNLAQCNNTCTLADPNAKADILGAILFCGSHKRTEAGQMVMVDEPFMGTCNETWNVQLIIERVIEQGIPNHYKRMRRIANDMGCERISEAIIRLFDEYDKSNDENYLNELFSDNDRSLYGVKPTRQPFKRKHAKHIENYEQQTIDFGLADHVIAEKESRNWKPFGAPD